MKKQALDEGTFAIGSLMFAVALAILITAAMPLIRLDWLGFTGSVIGATMTLAAAVVAWRAVQRQIVESRIDAERRREQEEFAARAMMPFALSALMAYAEACVTQLNELPNPLSHIPNIASPDLPTEHLESMRECLRYVGGDTAKQLFEIFAFLQIQNGRHRDIIQRIRNGRPMPLRFDVERRVADALDLSVLISQAFIYARGADYKIPSPAGMDLRDAFIRNRLNDSEYPVIERDIKVRGKRDGVDIIF